MKLYNFEDFINERWLAEDDAEADADTEKTDSAADTSEPPPHLLPLPVELRQKEAGRLQMPQNRPHLRRRRTTTMTSSTRS